MLLKHIVCFEIYLEWPAVRSLIYRCNTSDTRLTSFKRCGERFTRASQPTTFQNVFLSNHQKTSFWYSYAASKFGLPTGAYANFNGQWDREKHVVQISNKPPLLKIYSKICFEFRLCLSGQCYRQVPNLFTIAINKLARVPTELENTSLVRPDLEKFRHLGKIS